MTADARIKALLASLDVIVAVLLVALLLGPSQGLFVVAIATYGINLLNQARRVLPETAEELSSLVAVVVSWFKWLRGLLPLLALACLAGVATAETPGVRDIETAWSGWIAEQVGGQAEVPHATAGRVDVLTDKLAIEVEWPKTRKGPESIEQSRRYAAAFNKRPAVIFLIGRSNSTVAEKAIAATVKEFGKVNGPIVRVYWLDVRDPDIPKLMQQMGIPAVQEGSK